MTEITPFQFLETLFRESLRHGQLMLRSKIRSSGRTMTDWCFSLQQAARQVELYRNRREVLFGVALHDRQKALARARQRNCRAVPTRVRGSEESVTALPALWAELAAAPCGAGGKNHRKEVEARIEAMTPPPSMVVWTGTAYQAYWLLAEPWVLADEEDHRRAKRLLGKVAWAAAGGGSAEGRHPGRDDLAGLMQVAGTFHHPGSQRLPVVVERPPRGDRWTAGDFEHLADPPRRPRGTPWSERERAEVHLGGDAGSGREGDRQRLPGGRRGHLRPVWQGCSWLRHCYRQQETLSEAQWMAALSIVGRCQAGPGVGGASLARSFSRRHPGYLPQHTDQQLESVLNGKSGPARCRRIGGGLGAWDDHCCRCPHQGRIESPIDLGQAVGETAPATAKEIPRSVAVPGPGAGEAETPARPAPRGLAVPGDLEVEVVFRLSPGAGAPTSWPPLVQAAIACLEGSAADPGDEPKAGAGPRSAAGLAGRGPRPLGRRRGDRPPASAPRSLLDGLEELVTTLGAPVTARRMVETLAAEENHDRFDRLRTALRQLFPDLEGDLPTARQLGCALRSCARGSAGERQVVAVGRSRQGTTWAVRRTQAP